MHENVMYPAVPCGLRVFNIIVLVPVLMSQLMVYVAQHFVRQNTISKRDEIVDIVKDKPASGEILHRRNIADEGLPIRTDTLQLIYDGIATLQSLPEVSAYIRAVYFMAEPHLECVDHITVSSSPLIDDIKVLLNCRAIRNCLPGRTDARFRNRG